MANGLLLTSPGRAENLLKLRRSCASVPNRTEAAALTSLSDAVCCRGTAGTTNRKGEKKDVEPLFLRGVMLQVVPPPGFEPGRQPTAKVNPPVDFLVGHEISHEANHHAGSQPGAKQILDGKDRQGIQGKQRHDDQRVLGEVHGIPMLTATDISPATLARGLAAKRRNAFTAILFGGLLVVLLLEGFSFKLLGFSQGSC